MTLLGGHSSPPGWWAASPCEGSGVWPYNGGMIHPRCRSFLMLALIAASMPARGDDAWWSFRPVRRPEVPKVEGPMSANPIDAFIRAAQAKSGVTPSPEADRVTLIRRLSFDLRGLPPTPDEIDAFLADARPDAYERLVDHYLADPAFGERQATHWLDLARYADSAGFEDDAKRPDAWRYRDWVVNSSNEDMPYDRFVRLQLAADEVEPDRPAQRAALGFLRGGPGVGNERNERVRMDELDDIVATTTSAFLGLTVACARCHDHRADPIPTEDYYRLVAVFAPARFANLPLVSDGELNRHREDVRASEERLDVVRGAKLEIERPVRDRIEADRRSALPEGWRRAVASGTVRRLPRDEQAEIDARLSVTDDDLRAALAPIEAAAVAECAARLDRLARDAPPPLPEAPGVAESSPRASPVRVLIRGDLDRRGATVRPGPPRALTGEPVDFPDPSPSASTTRRRAALADWIASPTNPLTARVAVNRIWQAHFGRGLVATPSDLGASGDAPALPELLDWLASEFVASGWSREAIHRLIVTSASYRQSSRVRPDMARLDPDESLLWRHPLRRLDAEEVRDAILAISGTLDPRRGGPGVFPRVDPSVVRTGNFPRWPLDATDGPSTRRRSIYVFRMRSVPLPLLEALDQPDAARPCPARTPTTVPTQALILMNSPFVVDQSRHFADRVIREAGADPSRRIDLAFRLATGRAPTATQRGEVGKYLEGPGDFAGLCRMLYNSNAFLYLD